jgi:hypothetical protein
MPSLNTGRFLAFRAISHGVVPREALDFYRLRPDMRDEQG